MIIDRILTNNAVITRDEKGKEVIICGKGIGFKKRRGDVLDTSLIEKTFVLKNDGTLARFEQILTDVPIEYIQLSYDIVEMAKKRFNKTFNDSMIITLSDHLYVAISRHLEGITISNAMLYDVQKFYETEFEIAHQGLELIRQQLHVVLPEDEAGFIALHLVSAQLDDTNMSYTYEVTKVIQEITKIVKYHFGIELDTTSSYFFRYVTHLKFFALRLFNNKQYDDEENDLLDVVIDKYQMAYECVLRIKDHLNKKYKYSLSKDEILYLTIHVHRVVSKSRNMKGGDEW